MPLFSMDRNADSFFAVVTGAVGNVGVDTVF